MLSANADMEMWTGLTSTLNGDLDQLSDAFTIESGERVLFQYAAIEIDGQELTHVVAGETERSLREIVGAEGEELGLCGNFRGGQARAWQLDHGAYKVLNGCAFALEDFLGYAPNDRLLVRKLLGQADQRHHDLLDDFDSGFLCLHLAFKYCAGLHLGSYPLCYSLTTYTPP